MAFQATTSAVDIADDQTLHELSRSPRPEHFKDEKVTQVGEAKGRTPTIELSVWIKPTVKIEIRHARRLSIMKAMILALLASPIKSILNAQSN